MKPLGFILMLTTAFLLSYQQENKCGIKGDNKSAKSQYYDSLKNRPAKVGLPDTTITLAKLLFKGNDHKRFVPSKYVSVIGYIGDVKYGGSETCNCHTKDKRDWDTHIELVKDLKKAEGVNVVVCEITRYNTDPSLSYDKVLKMKGKKVRIEGLLFPDEAHWQNAVNTNPDGGDNLWRKTLWEIHPVCKITVL